MDKVLEGLSQDEKDVLNILTSEAGMPETVFLRHALHKLIDHPLTNFRQLEEKGLAWYDSRSEIGLYMATPLTVPLGNELLGILKASCTGLLKKELEDKAKDCGIPDPIKVFKELQTIGFARLDEGEKHGRPDRYKAMNAWPDAVGSA